MACQLKQGPHVTELSTLAQQRRRIVNPIANQDAGPWASLVVVGEQPHRATAMVPPDST
jgi:hypothetical protein